MRRWIGWLVVLSIAACAAALVLIVRQGSREEQRREVETARFAYRLKAGTANLAHRLGRGYDPKIDSDASDAERAFMDACRKCASAAECERDRLVIASGRASDSYNPCD